MLRAACAAIAVVLMLLPPELCAADAPRKAGEIVVEPATLTTSATEKIDYELGALYVPENRSDPKSRIIGVGFARFKATAPAAGPPTFHLPGGPGSSFLTAIRNSATHLLRYRAAGDVVIMDQRGFSRKGDVLKYGYRTQDEPLDQPASLACSTAAYLQLARDAVASFEKKGIDLGGYTVKECAEDVNDLRRALRYEKINLVGVSFGSQWSFAVMRLHPEIVARAMLGGVEPLNNGYDSPSGVLAATQRIWKDAGKDKALQPYIPAGGIDAAAREVVRRLAAAPVKVEVKDPKGGETVTVTLGKEDFQRGFLRKAADGPAWVLSLYHGHYEAWAAEVLAKRRSRSDEVRMIGPLIDTSLGVTPGRERELRGDPATELLGQWNWDAYIASKDIWPTADVGDDFRTPVRTLIPVLFVEGDWDTQTPCENTLEIAKSFPNSRVVLVERGVHVTLEAVAQRYPKEWGAMMDFLRTGDMPNLPERLTLSAPKFLVPDFPAPAAK